MCWFWQRSRLRLGVFDVYGCLRLPIWKSLMCRQVIDWCWASLTLAIHVCMPLVGISEDLTFGLCDFSRNESPFHWTNQDMNDLHPDFLLRFWLIASLSSFLNGITGSPKGEYTGSSICSFRIPQQVCCRCPAWGLHGTGFLRTWYCTSRKCWVRPDIPSATSWSFHVFLH